MNTAKQIMLSAELPKQTRTYKPVSHNELLDLTLESVHQAGFSVDNSFYNVAKEGQVANARFTIQNIKDSEMQLEIGWQNSYDKSLSLKFAIGTRIIVCANGMVSGDFGTYRNKHTGNIQQNAPAAIASYIEQAGDTFETLQKDREAFKSFEIDKRTQAELIGRMFIQEEIISSTQLNIIKRELLNPTHDYKAANSLWELYNHTTFALKGSHPSNWINSHANTHEFFLQQTNEMHANMISNHQIESMNELIDIF